MDPQDETPADLVYVLYALVVDDGSVFYVLFNIICVILYHESYNNEAPYRHKLNSASRGIEFHFQRDSKPGPRDPKSGAVTTRLP